MNARLVSLVLLIGFAAGCSVATAPARVRIEVRDAGSGTPVTGAHVRAAAVHLFVPADDVPLLGSQAIIDAAPPSDRGTTGDDGAVELMLAGRHPYRLLVVAPGCEPLEFLLERTPAAGEATPWIDAVSGEGVDPRRRPGLEIRVASP